MSVRLVATIGIMWGFLQLVCNGIALGPYVVAEADAGNPMMAALQTHPNVFAILLATTVSRAALAMVLMLGSVFALMLKPFGRQAMLVFAVGTILVTLVEAGVAIRFPQGLGPPPPAESAMTDQSLPPTTSPATTLPSKTEAQAAPATTQPGSEPAPEPRNVVLVVLGMLMPLIVPLIVLVVMTQPHVKAAFDRRPPSEA